MVRVYLHNTVDDLFWKLLICVRRPFQPNAIQLLCKPDHRIVSQEFA